MYLELVEVVLVQCNLVDNEYHQNVKHYIILCPINHSLSVKC